LRQSPLRGLSAHRDLLNKGKGAMANGIEMIGYVAG
jgi:hypothetical protein